ncbi:MAG: D-alanyl-D-alanine carboxypeptidase family protein [Alphaproteobacteria bacterium]
MKKIVLAFFMVFFINQAHASVSSIMIDAQSGDVLSSSNADELRYPASLTKLMTLYITFDALEKGLIKKTDMLKVSWTASNRSPSRLGLRAGETISVEDCINALIVKSANDVATVLAENIGYNEQNFAKTMTEVAHALGMKNTTFKNASGLPNKAQKTTARDMALLGAAMYHHFPQYYTLFSQRSFKYKGYTHWTHNHLLRNFDGADGMKTGYTRASGFNIVTSAQKDGKRVIAVTMGHKTADKRDNKIASLMNSGLEIKDDGSKDYGIQVGAFTNYAKARQYANAVNNLIKKKDVKVDVDVVETASTVMYRSQIIGFAKKDAHNTCNYLKKSKKSCIVISHKETKEMKLAYHDK